MVAGLGGLLLAAHGGYRKSHPALVWGMGFVLFFLWCFTIPMSELRGRPDGRLVACKSNLKNIATAIEMYGTDFEDSLPPKMESLTPNYLRTIPQCPAYGDDTSVPMWFISPPGNRDYVYQLKGDEFEVYCTGEKHRAAKVFSKDFPRLYSDSRGITEKPEAPVPESTPTPHDADD